MIGMGTNSWVCSVRTGESSEERVQRVLADLYRFCITYVTVLPDGRITIVRSVGSDGSTWSNPTGDLVVCLATQVALRSRDLLVVSGVEARS